MTCAAANPDAPTVGELLTDELQGDGDGAAAGDAAPASGAVDARTAAKITAAARAAARKKFIKKISVQLGETDARALARFHMLVARLGFAEMRELLQRTEEIEAAGGLMLSDGSRRRTRGGVFFSLAKRVTKERWPAKQKPPRPYRQAMLLVIEDVIRTAAEPLHTKVIAERAASRLPTFRHQDLMSEIGNEIALSLAQQGEASPFVRLRAGFFALRGMVERPREATPPTIGIGETEARGRR